MSSSPAQIWKSRISWRITLAVFLTIMTVQAGILSITMKSYEFQRLEELRDMGLASVVPLIDDQVTDLLRSPLGPTAIKNLLSSTKVRGIAVYSADLKNLLAIHGEQVIMNPMNPDQDLAAYREAGTGSIYETVYRPNNLRRPYVIAVRLDAGHIRDLKLEYIQQTILIMLLMSAFVTTVLMITLGYWLLEPILFMRNNLLKASQNPEDPQIADSPYDPTDEIGGAIYIAQKLINQNAANIRRIRDAAQDQIHQLAYFDTLTKLPNRTKFIEALTEQTKAQGDGAPAQLAVIAIDLDHFKDINDSMGHNVGDMILKAVGKRLRASMPEVAIVARSGEDEFAITMPLNTEVKTAREIGERILNVIRAEPFKVLTESFQVRASIGVATYPDDGTDPVQVLKNADIALNRSKEEGRDNVKEYSEDFDRAVQQRFQTLRDLRDALEKDQLMLYYQPQLDLQKGTVIGAEALLRWWKPDASKEGGHFIPPVDFIPIAEQSGLIVPIGEMVIRVACQTAAQWAAAGHNFRIAVNVSGAQFYQSDLVAYVSKILRETGLNPHKLELEVTESVFMEDVNHAIQTLQDLHALGVELAIDDFGTGYSSLSYLRQFPIDRLKIDQSFIRNALNNPDDAAIARTIVALGHSLNLKVIAEGVETKEHESFLLEHRCDEVQGYRYSRPIPLVDFDKFVATYNGDLGSFDR
ncbi:MAG: EAL domain-containing protein [Alphaproteobacteria bacterium]|nr:EAL domain-containing protein [Alphaproteobacteria bacterium]